MLDYLSFQHLSVLIERDANWLNAILLLPKDRRDASNQILICAHRTTVELRQLPTGKLIQTLESSSQPIRGLLVSPDRKLLFGYGITELYIWEMTSSQLLYATGECLDEYQGTITSMAFDAERNKLYLGSTNGSRECWNLKTQRWELGGFDCEFVDIDRHRHFLVGSYINHLKIWRLSDMQSFYRGDILPKLSQSKMTRDFSISALTVGYGGKIAYCGYQNGDVELWKTNRFDSLGVVERPSEDTYGIEENDPYGDLGTTCLALSPDEKVLAIGYGTGLIQLCDLKIKQSILTLWEHTTSVKNLVFTYDGNLLSSAFEGTVRPWGNPTR